VRVLQYATSFDAHAGLAASSGTLHASLADGDSGAALRVAALRAPLTLQLPRVALPPGTALQGAYWDASASPPGYATDGVVAMPSPAPAAGLTLSWAPGFDAAARDMRFAWRMDGPAAAGCSELLLDCADVELRRQEVSLDPENDLGGATVRCAAGATEPMRVVYGAGCALWRPTASGWCVTQHRRSTHAVMNECACTSLLTTNTAITCVHLRYTHYAAATGRPACTRSRAPAAWPPT
jgi:hypothetical protein